MIKIISQFFQNVFDKSFNNKEKRKGDEQSYFNKFNVFLIRMKDAPDKYPKPPISKIQSNVGSRLYLIIFRLIFRRRRAILQDDECRK